MTWSPHANNHSARSPRPKPEGPARDNPIAGPRTGTTRRLPIALASAGASGRHKEPGSRPASKCPAQPPSRAGGDSPGPGEGTTATGKPTGAPRATGPDEARRTNAGPRGTPERHTASHNHGTRSGAKPQRPPGAANPGSAHNTQRIAALEKVPLTARPPHPHPPHPRPVRSRPRPHARKDERSGLGERPSPDTPHPGRGRPPWAPSCRPHSAQGQLTRAPAVGLVTGPHASIPRTHRQCVVGPGRTPERTSGRGWESARPRTPHTQARGTPPGHPPAASTARKVSSQERALWGWCPVPTPAPPAPTASG